MPSADIGIISRVARVEGPSPIQPVYWTKTLHHPIVLYDGPLTLVRNGRPLKLRGLVEFRWLPSPRLAWEGWTDSDSTGTQALMAFADQIAAPGPIDDEIQIEDRSPRVLQSPPKQRPRPQSKTIFRDSGTLGVEPYVGPKKGNIRRAVFHLINFHNVTGDPLYSGRSWWRGRVMLDAHPWRVTLDARRDLRDVEEELRRTGGFAFTHVGELSRTDGRDFSVRTADQMLRALRVFFSLCRGLRSSPELPVGFTNTAEPKWGRWRPMISDGHRGAISWCSRDSPDSMKTLFPLFLDRHRDRVFRDALDLTVTYYMHGNRPDPINLAIVNAQSGLELLAWTHLVHAGATSRTQFKDLRAARQIERLLKALGIPTGIPTGMQALKRLAKNRGFNTGVDAVAYVRNRITHPDRTPLPVTQNALMDAWFLATWWLEVAILSWLRYTGPYENRLALLGHHRRRGAIPVGT